MKNFKNPSSSEKQPIRVACVTDYYLPGFKGGGPIRTIFNLQKILSGRVEFYIFTRDRDLGDEDPYPGVASGKWVEDDGSKIYYANDSEFGFFGFKRAVSNLDIDLIYLNSFFGFNSSISIVTWFRIFGSKIPVLLAPRGEFSLGALKIKERKKKLFLKIANVIGLYKKIFWHASSLSESQDIVRQFSSSNDRIFIAEDPVESWSDSDGNDCYQPSPSEYLNAVFISRISEKKNLAGLIEMLSKQQGNITLSVYGPIEDKNYWKKCLELVGKLPKNIKFSYDGVLTPDAIAQTFSKYDLFIFPTYGENFGHVIFEALKSGTPVFLSDQTPWKPDSDGAVQVFPLGEKSQWENAIELATNKNSEEKAFLSLAAKKYAKNFLSESNLEDKNYAIFSDVLIKNKTNRVNK